MLDLKGIQTSMKKLGDSNVPGEMEHITGERKEIRYTYFFNQKMAFTFGITRSSKVKAKKFHYVPRQMHLTKHEYQELYECPMSKNDYNKKLIDSGIV